MTSSRPPKPLPPALPPRRQPRFLRESLDLRVVAAACFIAIAVLALVAGAIDALGGW